MRWTLSSRAYVGKVSAHGFLCVHDGSPSVPSLVECG